MAYDEYYEDGWRMEATPDRIVLRRVSHEYGRECTILMDTDGSIMLEGHLGYVVIPRGVARALIESMFDRLMIAHGDSHDTEPVTPEARPATG